MINRIQDIECLISDQPIICIHVHYNWVFWTEFLHINIHIPQCTQFIMVLYYFYFVFGSKVSFIQILIEVIGWQIGRIIINHNYTKISIILLFYRLEKFLIFVFTVYLISSRNNTNVNLIVNWTQIIFFVIIIVL